MAATSLIELMFALGLAATLVSVAIVNARAALDEVRATAAARFVVATLQEARTRAIERGTDTALRVARSSGSYALTVYEDGNRNGVLSIDIGRGVDKRVGTALRLRDQFPGVDFGVLLGLPGADGSAPPGTDPIRVGPADIISFSPDGTSSSGSLYLRGTTNTQFAVRIYGTTGRTRILRYHPGTRRWAPL